MEMPTLINAHSRFRGEITLNTDARIDGEVTGKVESDKNVIIGSTGFVRGGLCANNLVVFGRIEGNIYVSGSTVLHSGSSIFGNLCTKVFEVVEGAIINGHVITSDKFQVLDEAQAQLAEEILKHNQTVGTPYHKQIHQYTSPS